MIDKIIISLTIILILLLILIVWDETSKQKYSFNPTSEYYYNCYIENNYDKGLCEVKARDYGNEYR